MNTPLERATEAVLRMLTDIWAIYDPDDVLATMATQRAAGWPEWHPEDYCHRCGGRNASWHVDSDRFNAAMGPPTLHRWNGIICPGCFVELHEAATGLTATWTLSPDTPSRRRGDKEPTHD